MTTRIGRAFMKRTRYRYLSPSDQMRGFPQSPLQAEFDGVTRTIGLPPPEQCDASTLGLHEAIANRRSVRRFIDEPLSLSELSYLLWATQGVREIVNETATFRTVPSAGARHAFETFLLVNSAGELDPGLYLYRALDHELAMLDAADDIAARITEGCLGQEIVPRSAVTFIWAAVAERMTWRYGERGYRYLHLDAGHVCQNLYLASQSVGCGTCAIAAFDDDLMNETLGLDGVERFVVYIAVVGKTRRDS